MRACDACRQRKVKCDGVDPCSLCRISSRACAYNDPKRKRGPKGPRKRRLPPPTSPSSPPAPPSLLNEPTPIASGSFVPDVDHPIHPRGISYLVQLRRELITEFQRRDLAQGMSPVEAVQSCISVFFQRSFPNQPILHELSLRRHAENYFGEPGSRDAGASVAAGTSPAAPRDAAFEIDPNVSAIETMRSFALVTAVAAMVSLLHGKTVISWGNATGPLFLRVSRAMLKEYEDEDISCPNSSSLQIRMLFSTCLQLTGHNELAWHVVGEASMMAFRMHLYSERVLAQYEPLEGTLLRACFWMLYTSDCTVTCTGKRAGVLHEPLLFDGDLDIQMIGRDHVPMLDPGNPFHKNGLETRILESFHLHRRTWALAARLMLAIRSYSRPPSKRNWFVTDAQGISNMYLDFAASIDTMAPTSYRPSISATPEDDSVARYQDSCLFTQRFRLLCMYHYAKLMVQRECGLHEGLTAAIGLRDDEVALTSEQLNTARDFIHTLQSVPFEYVQGAGETGVELIRLVGSVLLELSQTASSEATRERAQYLCDALLEILSRLDSKAINSLHQSVLEQASPQGFLGS